MNIHASLYHPASRAWSEPQLHSSQLVYPIFVTDKVHDKEIAGFEPNVQWGSGEEGTYKSVVQHLRMLEKKGLRSVMVFGVIADELKDETGSYGLSEKNPATIVTRLIRTEIPSLQVLVDVCIDEYTSHGHCGSLKNDPTVFSEVEEEKIINNKESVKILADLSLCFAKAGAHYVCPSDMMDNRVKAIREILDANGYRHVAIMSYTSKKASVMYAPFRLAVDSTFKGDRKRYQQPVGSTDHAAQALIRDLEEGASVVLVKPALFYADIISNFKRRMEIGGIRSVPIATYIVSGEYVMLKQYGEGCGALESVVMESHVSMLRAGASILITYFTPMILDILQQN
eukprot:maker-scaffold_13-snap-gene-9.54-mRNA-1 protein AED:0.17 eAED:0.17 QI:57/1/1/1/1/1/2/61/341